MLNKEDFTEDELAILKLAFTLMDEVSEAMSRNPFYTDFRNDWWHLQKKLGVTDWEW